MKTNEEIKRRQELFCNAYPQNKEYSPQAWALKCAINASVRRANVYSSDISMRAEARLYWESELAKLGKKYISAKQEKSQFFKDVFSLQKNINDSDYSSCFIDNHIRIGQCQKSLSVYLKWMWCQNQLADMPPVCPIDRQILNECSRVLRRNKKMTKEKSEYCRKAWSILDCKDLYKELVNLTEEVAELQDEPNRTVVWELFAFNEPDK